MTLIPSYVFTIGAILLDVADEKKTLVKGRLILGVGIKFSSMTVQIYIIVSASVQLRGRLVTVNICNHRSVVCGRCVL